jgi:hypothetical protein
VKKLAPPFMCKICFGKRVDIFKRLSSDHSYPIDPCLA